MKQTRHHLAEIIGKRTLTIKDTDLLAKEIAAYLLYEKQTSELDSLVRDIMQYRQDQGLVEAVAVTVSELPDKVIDDIEEMIEANHSDAKSVVISQRRDPGVVGGLRLDFANEQLDMSVKAKLSRFKQLTAQGKE